MTATNLYRPKDRSKLLLLHPDLLRVVERFEQNGGQFIVIETLRGKAAQEAAHNAGHSNARFGQSPHNYNPALAVDLGPTNYPGIVPKDYNKLRDGMEKAARELGIHIVWGGDWHSLKDWPHFELANWKLIAKHEQLAA